MGDPHLAAQMAIHAKELLQDEVMRLKTQSAKEQLIFIESRLSEKRNDFFNIQDRLSKFRDENRSISTAKAMNELDRLESEYNLALEVYTELAKQSEQAKFQVSKDTPIFMVLQKVSIPTEKSGPKRLLIIFGFTFMGVVFAISYILIGQFLDSFRARWSNEN